MLETSLNLDLATQPGIDHLACSIFEITTAPTSPIYIETLDHYLAVTDSTLHNESISPEIRVQAANLASVILNFELNHTKLTKSEKAIRREKVEYFRGMISAYDHAQRMQKAA